MKYLLIFPLLLGTWAAHAFPIPKEEAVPGGVAYVSLGKDRPTKVVYEGSPVLVRPQKNGWQAIIGLPLTTPVGPQTLKITRPQGSTEHITFLVHDKHYEEQHITIKNKRKVNPYAQDMERIIREKSSIIQAFKKWTNRPTGTKEQFTLPVRGPMSSPFGKKRFFNEQPRKPHSGLDIAADEGTPIQAPASGTVILTGNFFFNGNSVFIDHGQGLVSMYCHMHRIDVKQGQSVQQGDPIGQVGQTGRATGPHLHWSVSLNNARINPLLFFPASPFPQKKD